MISFRELLIMICLNLILVSCYRSKSQGKEGKVRNKNKKTIKMFLTELGIGTLKYFKKNQIEVTLKD